ncbi:MAG: HAD family hydrolase, partial [Solirubrobacteraceae bacterium]
LFTHPDGTGLLVEAGWSKQEAEAAIESAWRESKTAVAIEKGRDRDPALHRRGWMELFGAIDERSPGMARKLYDATLMPDTWVPYADTAPVLRELHHRGVPVQVLSNIAQPLAALFSAQGLGDTVHGFTLSYLEGREKPDPELFRIACRALGTDGEETLMVGDSHLTDGAAALLGMPVLLLPMVPRGAVRGLARVLDLVPDAGAPGR